MIEKILIDYLSEALDVPVYAESPEEAEDSYVLVEKTGGGEAEYISTATVAIQSYARSSMLDAILLNAEVKSAMREAVTLNSISSVQLNSDYNFTDETKKIYRYQAVYSVVWFDD